MNEIVIDSLSQSAEHSITALKQIAQLTESVAQNTEFSYLSGDFTLIATISTIATVFTLGSLYFGVRQSRIDKMCQRKIFDDIIRHFYRNKICISAMRAKYIVASESGTKHCYPSEEHYLKLNVLPDDLHLEKYYRKGKTFDMLHKLHMLMRNFNIEAEVALSHIKDEKTPYKTKLRDFATLDFKCGFLTQKICEVMTEIWGSDKIFDSIWDDILTEHNKNESDNKDNICPPSTELQAIIAEYREGEENGDKYFTNVIDPPHKAEFSEMLTYDIFVEVGNNSKGDEKIHIIGI